MGNRKQQSEAYKMLVLSDGMNEDYRNKSVSSFCKGIDARGFYTDTVKDIYRINIFDEIFGLDGKFTSIIPPTYGDYSTLENTKDFLCYYSTFKTSFSIAHARNHLNKYGTSHYLNCYGYDNEFIDKSFDTSIISKTIAAQLFTIAEPGYLTIYLDNMTVSLHDYLLAGAIAYADLGLAFQLMRARLYDIDGGFAMMNGYNTVDDIDHSNGRAIGTRALFINHFDMPVTPNANERHLAPYWSWYHKFGTTPYVRKLSGKKNDTSFKYNQSGCLVNKGAQTITLYIDDLYQPQNQVLYSAAVGVDMKVDPMLGNNGFFITDGISLNPIGNCRITGVRFDKTPPAQTFKTTFVAGDFIEGDQIVSRVEYDLSGNAQYTIDFSGVRIVKGGEIIYTTLVIDNRENNFNVTVDNVNIPSKSMVQISAQKVYTLKGAGIVRISAYQKHTNQKIEAF